MNNKKTLLGVILIIIIVILFACSGRGYKDTAIGFIEAIHDADAKELVSLMSEDLLYDLMEKSNQSTKKVFISTLDKALEKDKDSMKDKYGKKWKYEIEYVDSVKNDDTCTVYLNVTYKGKKWFSDKEDVRAVEIEMVKVGKNWYVDTFPHI